LKVRGIDLEIHENEDLSNHIRREQDFFEAPILDWLKIYAPKQKTILDIGANIGNHSVYFANYFDYESIISFEPIPANYELLKKNMAPYDRIGLSNFAVSSSTMGNLLMVWKRDNYGASNINEGGYIKVMSVSIDRLMFTDVTLMKIDVEGHEPEVIEGANETIIRCRPLILIEDWKQEYGALLPYHKMVQGWPEHATYLYEWDYERTA
jgi:FkbM family methyltransferase